MNSMKIAGILFVLMALLVSVNSHSQESTQGYCIEDGHVCTRDSEWFLARNISISSRPDNPEQVTYYEIRMFENHDMHISVKHNAGPLVQSAEAISVEGRALLVKDIQLDENYAIDILDGTVLIQKLVLAILDFASEKGPQKSIFPLHKKIKESKYPMKLTNQSAQAVFGSPWEAVIDLSKQEDGTIDYNIAFSYSSPENKKAGLNLKGKLSDYGEKPTNTPLPDALRIAEWRQYKIGPYTKTFSNATIYDFGTTYIEKPFQTLGQLREYVKTSQ